MDDATPFTPDQEWGRPVPPVVFSDSPEATEIMRAARHRAQVDYMAIQADRIRREVDPAAGSHLYHD